MLIYADTGKYPKNTRFIPTISPSPDDTETTWLGMHESQPKHIYFRLLKHILYEVPSCDDFKVCTTKISCIPHCQCRHYLNKNQDSLPQCQHFTTVYALCLTFYQCAFSDLHFSLLCLHDLYAVALCTSESSVADQVTLATSMKRFSFTITQSQTNIWTIQTNI